MNRVAYRNRQHMFLYEPTMFDAAYNHSDVAVKAQKQHEKQDKQFAKQMRNLSTNA